MNPETVKRWFADKGDETHRLEYPLNDSSVVFDVGAYVGNFADAIHKKYGCYVYCFEPIIDFYSGLFVRFQDNPKIQVFPFAITNKNSKVNLIRAKDSSRIGTNGHSMVQAESCTMESVMEQTKRSEIDLLKLNIEGAEYDVLSDMLGNDLVKQVKNIQVQFHDFIPNYKALYEIIREQLELTHELTYHYPFVWENWRRK